MYDLDTSRSFWQLYLYCLCDVLVAYGPLSQIKWLIDWLTDWLNSRVTHPKLTKFLQNVKKWLPITILKSKLRSSNPFQNAKVTNEDRRQIADESRQKLCVLPE